MLQTYPLPATHDNPTEPDVVSYHVEGSGETKRNYIYLKRPHGVAVKKQQRESVIDSTIPITRTLIPELSYVIIESCVIKSKSDYRIDSIEHHLKDVTILNLENELSLRCGCNIDTSLTSILI